MRRYLISFLCLIGIAGLLVVLLRPWSGHAHDWPDISREKITRLDFSGGQNYSLELQEGRWYVRNGVTQSLASQNRVSAFLEQLNQVQPKRELPGLTGGAAEGTTEENHPPDSAASVGERLLTPGTPAENAGEGNKAGDAFGPERSEPLPGQGEKLPELSILPTSITLWGENTWTIAPLVYVEEAGLVSTRLIKNGQSEIVYLDPMFTRLLSRPPRYYADLNLFSARPDRVRRIEVLSPGGEVWELAKLNEGTFTFMQPERFKDIEVPQVGMEFYLHAILSTQSPGPLFARAPEDLEEPFLVVKTVQVLPGISAQAGQEEEILTISRRRSSGDYVGFSSYQGAYFVISAERVEQLGRSLLSLRSRPVLPSGIGRVEKVKLLIWDAQGQEQSRVFSRSETGWSELDSAVTLIGVDTLLWRLGTLQTEGRSEGPLPEDLVPLLRWQFEYEQGKDDLTLTFYTSPSENNCNWVRINEETTCYPVHFGSINEILTLLPAPPAEGKEK